MSDVVATILILALTVVLFASLFAFVSRFPAPPAQAVNQFEATVTRSATAITGISILQAGGPPVPASDRVYLQSSRTTANWQFSQASGVPVAWGTGNATGGWGTGQYWTETFKTPITLPANITIYIVSSSQLLYSGVVPGAAPNAPPILTSTYTVPATPAVGAAFQIVAIVSGNTANLTLNVSVSEVPGLPSAVQAMHPYGTGEWVYNVSAGLTTKNGTYLGFIQGVNNTGSTLSGSVTITLPGTGGSGGTSPTLSAAISVSPSLPTVRTNATFQAIVTNSGTTTATVSNVTYYVNNTSSKANLVTLYAKGTLPSVTAHGSVTILSPVWMVPPTALAGITFTVVVSFSTPSGTYAIGTSVSAVNGQPMTGAVSVFSQNSTQSDTGTWNVIVTITNFGSLGASSVNITVYVNKSGSTTTEGKVVSPGGQVANPGYATLASGNQSLGATATLTDSAMWRGGSVTGYSGALSVQVVVKIVNSAWSSLATPVLKLTYKVEPGLTTTFT